MNTTYIVVGIAMAFLLAGAILGPILARRRRMERLQQELGADHSRPVKTADRPKMAEDELKERGTLNIRPLSADEHRRYQAAWDAVQAKFVDQPGQATIEADHLIVEVMQLRDFPVSTFEQRAADVSVNYPALITDYRTAHQTAIRNKQHHAGTEDLRRAMLSYRSLFDELVGRI